ncbi:hypothetical protein D9758_011618 [Tetrapyrgos nigripes]|uniref:Blue (type 1) copper domain-containing protein n=1 Tax=Tetrapyrgos nigripes TaxID=182062 RepID=A0A8H5FSG3_9AGAR|nr:hypothetical protein D9758_011618 [Tetrapyrgos nigripes]
MTLIMMFSTLVSLGALPALVYAQYGGGGGSPPPTSSAPASAPSAPANTDGHVNVDVAFQGGYVFNPANISAPVGTLVTFWFPTTSNGAALGPHSVTQSSFANPCTYLQANDTAKTAAGFDSGLQAITTFTINITDTQRHCGMGMVGSINAPTNGTNTFDAFMSAAKAIGGGETLEQDNGPVISGVHATAVGSPTPSSTGGSSGSGASALAPSSFLAAVFATVFAFAL